MTADDLTGTELHSHGTAGKLCMENNETKTLEVQQTYIYER